MGALPRPEVTGPARTLNDALHDLHHRAGWPSLRTLARETGVSHTTVSKAFSHPALPTWGTLELLVEAMSGSVEEFHQLWLAASTPTNGDRPTTPRIAGRRAELEVVRHHLEAGTGLLLVTGEAGIGKTALVSAAIDRADAVVGVGHCLPLSTDLPLLPVADAVRDLRDADPQLFASVLDGCPRHMRESLGRMMPELRSAEDVGGEADEFARPRLFTSVSELLAALTARRPTALLVEDLHWADATTLDLLAHLASRPGGPRVVATWRSRDADVAPGHLDWLARIRRGGAVPTVALAPLSREETAEQLRLARGDAVSDELVTQVFAKGQGLPLFSAQLAAADAAVPEHLAELLDLRLGQLDGADWTVARTLGLAQRRLPSAVLQAATGLADDELARALRRLAERHLLRAGTGEDVELAHPLLADAVRRRLVPGEAPAVHCRLAEVLAEQADVEPGELAGHWQGAGRPDREVGSRARAAVRARERFAHREELTSWLRVLELWDAGSTPEGLELWEALIGGIHAASETGELDVGRALAQRATALELPDSARIHVARWAGALLCEAGDQEAGQHHFNEAVALLDRLPPSLEHVDVLQHRIEYAGLTQFAEAWSAIRRAHAMLDEQEDLVRRRRLLNWQSWYELAAGDITRGLEVSARARAITLEEDDPTTDVALSIMATDLLLHAGAPADEVVAAARDALDEVTRWHLEGQTVEVILRMNVCMAHLRRGDVDAAAVTVDPVASGEPNPITALAQVLRAEIDVCQGDVEGAQRRCRAALEHVVNRQDEAWLEAVVSVCEIETWAGHPAAAATFAGQAIASAAPTEASRMVAPVLVVHARAVADVIDADDASPAERRRAGEQLRVEASSTLVDPFGPSGMGVAVPASAATWRAEVARTTGHDDVQAWAGATKAWESLDRPHDAAYCRWRAAQCALREGQGTVAGRLLKRAAAEARTHVPLSRAIAGTAAG